MPLDLVLPEEESAFPVVVDLAFELEGLFEVLSGFGVGFDLVVHADDFVLVV